MVQSRRGNDRQGFLMKQGVLTHGRGHLLLSKGHSCPRPRRTGGRKCGSLCGCSVDVAECSQLGIREEKDIWGLTDTAVSQQLGPQRALKSLKETESFSFSLKKMMSTDLLSESS